MEIGLLGTDAFWSLIIMKQDNEVMLSFSYRSDLIIKDFAFQLQKLNRNETERLSSIVKDLQYEISAIRTQNSAQVSWQKLKLLNGATAGTVAPQYALLNRVIYLRGSVRVPEQSNGSLVLLQLPKEFFSSDFPLTLMASAQGKDTFGVCRVDVRGSGEAVVSCNKSMQTVFLDGISFLIK